MLRVPDGASLESYRTLLKEPVLSELIDECFRTGGAILRRSVTLSDVPPASPINAPTARPVVIPDLPCVTTKLGYDGNTHNR